MKGKKLPQKKPITKTNQKNKNDLYKINNEISPHLNVLQFNLNNNNNNNINNTNKYNNINKQTKKVRNLSQKPISKSNYNNNIIPNIQNNNYYFNNINNNFIVKNNLPRNSKNQINPLLINKQKNNNIKINRYNNNNNKKENIKIKLDEKGVYIAEEEDIYEDPKDPMNKLNSALKYKQENNLAISQEEKDMIETIKKVSSNRVQYRNTHQMLKEIGKIMKNPVVSFLIKKEPNIENKDINPSEKLSEKLSQKLLDEQRQKKKEKKEEDIYYEQLQKRIKDEIRNKGSFDFSKLPDKDRQMLAQRKVYNKIGIKVYENYSDNIDNKDNNNKINIDEKLDNQIKKEINREKQKEEFLNEIEKYKKDNEEVDDYFNLGEINNNNNKINEYDYNDYDKENKEKPTARGILEKVLNQIEYKNEQLINHNNYNENINRKKKY